MNSDEKISAAELEAIMAGDDSHLREGATYQSENRDQGRRRDFISVGELLDEPEEEWSDLVAGLLPVGGLSLFAGKPKTGKSVTVQNLSVCIARGEPFLGRDVKQGPVLYCALEERRAEVRRHFRALRTGHDDTLYIWVGAAPAEAHQWLIENAERFKPRLIIVDRIGSQSAPPPARPAGGHAPPWCCR